MWVLCLACIVYGTKRPASYTQKQQKIHQEQRVVTNNIIQCEHFVRTYFFIGNDDAAAADAATRQPMYMDRKKSL